MSPAKSQALNKLLRAKSQWAFHFEAKRAAKDRAILEEAERAIEAEEAASGPGKPQDGQFTPAGPPVAKTSEEAATAARIAIARAFGRPQ